VARAQRSLPPGNLRHVQLRFLHGEWDRSVGGGVSVEHSRQMDRKLTEHAHDPHARSQPRPGSRPKPGPSTAEVMTPMIRRVSGFSGGSALNGPVYLAMSARPDLMSTTRCRSYLLNLSLVTLSEGAVFEVRR